MSYKQYDPVWKRWQTVPSAVDDAANVMSGYDHGYEQQLSLTFKPRDATVEETEKWQEEELKWWADRQLNFVAIATIIQISALGFMGAVMCLNSQAFG